MFFSDPGVLSRFPAKRAYNVVVGLRNSYSQTVGTLAGAEQVLLEDFIGSSWLLPHSSWLLSFLGIVSLPREGRGRKEEGK